MASRHDPQMLALRSLERGLARGGASFDSRRSIELVNDNAQREYESGNMAAAARKWLDEQGCPPAAARRLEHAMSIAQTYMNEINDLAMSVVHDAQSTNMQIDLARMEQIQRMTSTVEQFNTLLKDVLHDAINGSMDSVVRLDAALAAGDAPGAGLVEVVDSLTASANAATA